MTNGGRTAGVLKLDVKKFSHGLRDHRNYVHSVWGCKEWASHIPLLIRMT